MSNGRFCAAQAIADPRSERRPRVVLFMLERAAEREVHLRFGRRPSRARLEQRAHRRDLGVAEYIVLEIREAQYASPNAGSICRQSR